MKHFKSVLAMLLALVMILSCVGGAFAADKTEVTEIAGSKGSQAVLKEAKGFKSEKFQSENTYKYADDEVVRAIVVLEGSPEADVAVRGTDKAANTRAKLQNQHANVRKAMTGIDYELVKDFTTLLNGFSADVAYGDLEKIAALDGVEAVYIANHYAEPVLEKEPETKMASSNYFFTGVDDAYGEYGVNGSGTVIAVLDTGFTVTHEAFADADGNCAATGKLSEDDLVKASAPGQYVSAKFPFVYDYAEFDNDVTDYNGHGTHVAGIAAGCAYSEEEGAYTFLGAASGAQILGMKIFYDAQSGTSSDIYLAALEDAYRLGADVINMSIGAQNGFTYDSELETFVYGNIYKRLEAEGIVVCVSAGNEYSMAKNSFMGYIGPEYQDYGTIASPAAYEGNVSVASVENYLYPANVLVVGEYSFSYTDSSDDGLWLAIFGDEDAVEYVIVPGDEDGAISYGYAEDYEGVDVTGKIAVVSRGDIAFEEKVENAANAGAIGCIVVNNQAGTIAMAIETFEIPAVSVNLDAKDVLMNAEEKKVSSPSEKGYVVNENAGLMSDFSNWGTSPSLTLDPTVTSVGGMIYSASNAGDDEYEVMSGTSMSSPNFAGTVATVLQFLEKRGAKNEDGDWLSLTKAEKAERAKALLESTAQILYDGDGYPYSPRKQGAGLANAYSAADAYYSSSFILDPIQELGDDAEKTGHYTFDVTVKNEGDDSFLVPSEDLMYDWVYDYYEANGIESDEPLYMNSLTSEYLYDGEYTANYTVAGESVNNGFWVEYGETVTVTVDIQLSEEIMDDFDGIFPNGNYVEGFVYFDNVDATDDGEVLWYDADKNAYLFDADGAYLVSYNSDTGAYEAVIDTESGEKVYYAGEDALEPHVYYTTHATMLTFYGDWTDGDILESVDFRDVIDAEYWLNATEDGQAYAAYLAEMYETNYGVEGYEASFTDVLEFYTSPNMAFTAQMSDGVPTDLVWYLGDNLFGYAEFYEEHISFSTFDTDADGIYANGMYITPYQLRNCRNLIMTITDKETGDVYFEDNTEYLPKAMYDEENAEWSNTGAYYWDGTDADGNYVPSGTKVTVQFDAVLPYGDTPVEDILSFDCEVDYTAPVIEDIIFDEEAQTLTVTASDESYLANIALCDDSGETLDVASFSSDEEGAGFTATFDVSELMAYGYDYVTVAALDYATNETDATAYLFDVGVDATITLVTPDGTVEVPVVTGDTYTFEACEATVEDAEFFFWVDCPVESADEISIWDTVSAVYFEGTEILVTGDMTVYACYGVGEYVPLEKANYWYNQAGSDYTGDWALVGLDYVDGYDSDNPNALGADLEKVVVADLDDAEIGDDYVEFYTNDLGVRFTVEHASEDTYTICSAKTGKYLAVVDGALALVDEADASAEWYIEDNEGAGNGTLITSAAAADMVLVYNEDTEAFELMDNTEVYYSGLFGDYYPGEWFTLWMYTCDLESFELEYFTTELCNHSHTEVKDAVAAGCETEGYSGDVYCTDCGALVSEGSVVAATGHDWDAGVISKPATCTEDGTRTYLCANCGQIRDEVIKASGHSFGDWVVTKPATAAVKGEKQRTCAICGYVETAEIDALGYQKCYVTSFDDCGKIWYHEAIDFAVANGLMDGVADTKFDPDGAMTRAMVVTVLYREAGEPEVTAPSTFTDVAEGQWYFDAVAWAQENGVVTGVAADKFAPNDDVTREQLATILWRYAGKPAAKADLSGFEDAESISGYALDAMNWAVEAGILAGDNGNLKPTANATRAEFATMIMRFLGGSYECDQMKDAG